MTAREWIAAYSAAMAMQHPGDDEVEAILALAGDAAPRLEAHGRPGRGWVVARSGTSAAEALALARTVGAFRRNRRRSAVNCVSPAVTETAFEDRLREDPVGGASSRARSGPPRAPRGSAGGGGRGARLRSRWPRAHHRPGPLGQRRSGDVSAAPELARRPRPRPPHCGFHAAPSGALPRLAARRPREVPRDNWRAMGLCRDGMLGQDSIPGGVR